MIRRRNHRNQPGQWPGVGNMIVIRPWPNGPAERGAVVAAGPHGVLLAGRQTATPWTAIWAFDEYDGGDEYRDGEPEWTPSLFVDCEAIR